VSLLAVVVVGGGVAVLVAGVDNGANIICCNSVFAFSLF
jgi:hypothetical protein